MSRCLLPLLLMLVLSATAFAQTPVGDYDLLQFRMRVKQIGEFMARFNQDQIPPNLMPGDTLLRHKAFVMLFDRDLIDRRQDEVWQLVQRMVADERRLSFTDTTWSAEATCNVTLQGKPNRLTLTLRIEHVDGYRYKWVIDGASGAALALNPHKSNPGLRISPTDNELNFISLRNITQNEYPNILNYKSAGSRMDGLSVFMALVKSGSLKINYVEELQYFFDAPGYRLVVSNFRRDDLNSGWLISDFAMY